VGADAIAACKEMPPSTTKEPEYFHRQGKPLLLHHASQRMHSLLPCGGMRMRLRGGTHPCWVLLSGAAWAKRHTPASLSKPRQASNKLAGGWGRGMGWQTMLPGYLVSGR